MAGLVTRTVVFSEDTGEVFSDKSTKGSQNGKGWVMMYSSKVEDLLLKCPSAATLKVFMFLAINQQFDEKGVFTTKKFVEEKLNITKKTCLEAFKWLRENGVISEVRANGISEFMVNPDYVTVGRDKKKRVSAWNKRRSASASDKTNAPIDKRRVISFG